MPVHLFIDAAIYLYMHVHLFGVILGHFGVTVGWLWDHFGWLWGDFGVTLGSLWGHLGDFGVTLGLLFDPSGLINRKYIFFQRILRFQGWVARKKGFRSGGLGPPGRNLERGKPLFRRKRGEGKHSRRPRPHGPGGFWTERHVIQITHFRCMFLLFVS